MFLNRIILLISVFAVTSLWAVAPGSGAFYATDAYPGFDSESKILPQSKKEPSIFWWRWPKCDNPKSQLAYAQECANNQSYGKAVKEYEALVAQWPSSDEAPIAQEALADLLFNNLKEYREAFEEYKYLVDFYSSQCNYSSVVSKMYDAALEMRKEGKLIIFFRITDTVTVRRALEAVVLRASGALYAPDAMLAIAELREKDEEWSEAIQVYKNLRNRYSSTSQAKVALMRETDLRMKLLRAHEYNRARSLETASFLKMAAASTVDPDKREQIAKWYDETNSLIEKEAYLSAKFYDSKTRKVRGAINAYERFLKDYPTSKYATEVRARLEVLKGNSK